MILATGKLVEIEVNDKGYRTAHVLNGRYVDSFGVGSRINGELDAMLDRDVVLELRKNTRWLDVGNNKRLPSESVYVVAVHDEIPAAA